jgi:hypothetical protein
MGTSIRIAAAVVGVCVGMAGLTRAQVELDRIVARVGGRPILQSDVQQARALNLVDDTASDAAALRALENRWLMLEEISKAAPLPTISDAVLAARVAEWQAMTRDVDRSGLPMAMSDAEIRVWLRDDLRIRAYLDRRFSMLTEPDRLRARADWIARLRKRAELD